MDEPRFGFDHRDYDITAGRVAGLHTALIRRGPWGHLWWDDPTNRANADVAVTTLLELTEWLSTILAPMVGFVARLKTIDLDVPRICGRLIDAGLRAARKARDADSDAQLIHIEATGPIAPIQPWDHPDLVLARAVAAAVIDADEANLISATRLDNATVAQVADKLGIAASKASALRAKAERRLAAAISAGEMRGVALNARFAGNRDEEARRNGLVRLPPRPRPSQLRHAGDLRLRDRRAI